MYVKRIVLKNFMRFTEFDQELALGSVGVFGCNGAGKSTFLNSIYALITNDFGRFDGVKVDCIRNTAGDKEESYISGELHHNQHVLQITRRLRGKPVSELVVDGGKPITDSAKVEDELSKLLGVERRLLDLYVFKTQDKIYDFLTTTPGERAKAFGVLCRTEKCEEIWDYLGTILNKDKEINEVIEDNSDEITQSVVELKTTVTDLEAKAADEEKLLLNSTSEASARGILRKQDRMEDLLGRKEKTLERRGTLEVRLGEAQQVFNEAEARTQKWQKAVDTDKPQVDDARASLKAVESYKKYKQQRAKLKKEAEALEEEERMNTPPEPMVETNETLEDLKDRSLRKRQALMEAREVISHFDKSGVMACPTCKTPVAAIQDVLSKHRKTIKDFPAEISALASGIAEWEAHDAAVRKYEKWRAAFDAKVKANQQAREAMKDVKAPDGDEAEIQEVIDEFDVVCGRLASWQKKRDLASQTLQQVLADMKSANKQLNEIEEGIAENMVSDEVVEKARRRLDEHTAAQQNIARVQGELRGVNQQIDAYEEQLKKLRAKLKRSKKVKRIAKIAEEVRDVLHRDRLPRRVAATNLSSMEGDINGGLGNFADPFWVESDESLNFIAHKPGEPPQRAAALSTGQKVVLALAFWPAVASLWSQDLGMLALDEPTANLDEDNRKFLVQALGVMSAKARGHRQVIMVTHDPNLRTAFDQVIDIGV